MKRLPGFKPRSFPRPRKYGQMASDIFNTLSSHPDFALSRVEIMERIEAQYPPPMVSQTLRQLISSGRVTRVKAKRRVNDGPAEVFVYWRITKR
jgi:DNA-binding HxlR family transcriptional regulator